MPQSLNIRHLKIALETAKSGSFSAAARRVHLSQSAVTQAISRLESSLGCALFSRTATGVLPTEAGEVFLQRVARAMQWIRTLAQLAFATQQHRRQHAEWLLSNTQLRALSAVVAAGSYTRAAARLGVTQPTVHRAVKELENICGQSFFRRSPQGVEPSWQARQVVRYSELFFAELAQGIAEVQEWRGLMGGRIVVGALPFSRTRLVPHAVTRLLEEYPDTEVHIVDGPYEEQFHSLLHAQVDVIVGALRDPSPSPDVIQELLFSDKLDIVVRRGHRLARRRRVSPRELRDMDWIAPREHTPARELFHQFFLRQGLEPPRHVVECSSLVATRGLLMESDRAALLPARQVQVDVDCGLLAVSPVTLAGASRDIGLTLRRDWRPTRVQDRFLSLLRENRSSARTKSGAGR